LYTLGGSILGDEFKGHHKDRKHRGEHEKRRGPDSYKRGAKTFRRGRAIAFLDMLNLKRKTLKQQLETPELQSINPILVGELKAIETVINEYVQLFELYEEEEMEKAHVINEEVHPSMQVSKEHKDKENH
jgi:hypothetical protein